MPTHLPFRLTIKNYRCFIDSHPCRIDLAPGFTSLIGVNNSGKSSLLKFFYDFRSLFTNLNSPNAVRSLALDHVNFAYTTVQDPSEVFCRFNDRPIQVEIELLLRDDPRESKRLRFDIERHHARAKGALFQLFTRFEQVIEEDVFEFYEIFRSLSQSMYIGPFRNAIQVGSNRDYFDIQIGQQFVEKWNEWKNGTSVTYAQRIMKLTQEICHLFKFGSLEINPSQDRTTLYLVIEEQRYGLSEVGAGIAQFIVVLANALMRPPNYILIDEPELSLHPSLQLDFLTTLASYATDGVLFATHNLGLARAGSDRIYAVRREAVGPGQQAGKVEPFEVVPRLPELVGELSYSGRPDLGFSKILLVEGPTEIKTIQQFLRAYRKEHEIVLLPLYGRNLIKGGVEVEYQLQEVRRISTDVSVLIDSERQSEAGPLPQERSDFLQVCQNVGIPCHVLERRAIENYFTSHAIQQAFGSTKYEALGSYCALASAPNGWPKSENWRIARLMCSADLDGTDLGQVLKEL